MHMLYLGRQTQQYLAARNNSGASCQCHCSENSWFALMSSKIFLINNFLGKIFTQYLDVNESIGT